MYWEHDLYIFFMLTAYLEYCISQYREMSKYGVVVIEHQGRDLAWTHL